MKKIFFALCVAVIGLCSCQGDEDYILGEWNLKRVDFCDSITGKIIKSGADVGEVWTTLNFSESTLIATIDYDDEDIESYLYLLKDNTLSLIDGNWIFKCNVLKLTKDELVFSYPDHMWNDDDEYIEGIAKFYYKK